MVILDWEPSRLDFQGYRSKFEPLGVLALHLKTKFDFGQYSWKSHLDKKFISIVSSKKSTLI